RMLELKAPARPFSPETTIRSTVCSGRRIKSGWRGSPVLGSYTSARETSDLSTFVSICAYGRAARARSCARRSLAAETICMALVIWRVFFTLRMRRRMSKRFAMFRLCSARRDLPRAHEALFEIPQGFFDVSLHAVINDLLLHERRKQLGIHGVHILIQ